VLNVLLKVNRQVVSAMSGVPIRNAATSKATITASARSEDRLSGL